MKLKKAVYAMVAAGAMSLALAAGPSFAGEQEAKQDKASMPQGAQIANPDDASLGLRREDLPEIVQAVLQDPEDKVVSRFDAEAGLTGWVIIFDHVGPASPTVFYTTNDAKYLIAGTLYGSKGEEVLFSLNEQYVDLYAPKLDTQALWDAAETMDWIAEGAKGDDVKAVMYIYADMNCIFCHFAWKALTPYMEKGLQVRWIPVGVLTPDSATKASYIMRHEDPEYALQQIYSAFQDKDNNIEKDGFEVSSKDMAVLDRHLKAMHAAGGRGTPTILYKDREGSVQVNHGMFRLGLIPEMTGIPFIENTDPSLERFDH